MSVTHNLAGYTGTVDQVQEARRFAFGGGGRFKVASSADWLPSVSGSVNRQVNIAAGSAFACGVYDTTTAIDSVTVAANVGGTTRYDAIVASFDWSAGTVAFGVVQGTTVPPVAVSSGTTVDTTKVNWLPGLRYDAVLAVVLVRPGVTLIAPSDLYDLRTWGNWDLLNCSSGGSFPALVDIDPGGMYVGSAGGRYRKLPDGTWVCENAFGKMWRTSGFSNGNLTLSAYQIPCEGSRVLGGFTFTAPTSTYVVGPNGLTIPFDSLYDLEGVAYLAGNTTANGGVYAVRQRSGVADANINLGQVVKFATNLDSQMGGTAPKVPLKAGDKLVLGLGMQSGTVSYYGNTEIQGSWLSAAYAGPLNGATPV